MTTVVVGYRYASRLTWIRPSSRAWRPWLYPWTLAYAAVGTASLLVPLDAMALGADARLVGLLASTDALAGVPRDGRGPVGGGLATPGDYGGNVGITALAVVLGGCRCLPGGGNER